MINNTTPGRWLRRVVWIGIAANILLALLVLAAPAVVIRATGLPTATLDLWPRFSALLLILVSAFSMPAGMDIDRYPTTAWLTVASWAAGSLFFMFEPRYRLLMYFDLAFFLSLAVLLTMALRSPRPAASARTHVATL